MSLARRVMERKAAGQAFDYEAARLATEDDAALSAEYPSDDTTAPEDGGEPPNEPLTAAGGSIARRHRLKILAQTTAMAGPLGLDASADLAAEDPAAVAAAEMLMRLNVDRARLKMIQSTETKIELKRELVLAYDPWINGLLAAASNGARGIQDEVLVTMMIWRIDIGDFIGALPLCEYVIRWDLKMPGHFKSTAPVFITETIAEAAIKAFHVGGDEAAAFPAGVLPAVEDLMALEDMHDQVRAKLQKAIGMAVIAGADPDDDGDRKTRQAETLRRYLRAMELDPKAGVKKQIEQLNRDLGIQTVPGRLDQVAPAT